MAMARRRVDFDQRVAGYQREAATAAILMNQAIVIATHTERPILPDAVLHLYQTVNWPWVSRQPALLAKVLATGPAVGAWDGERLIGFARAVTDGYFRAYIEDVVVHPTYQRQGIGRQLLSHLLGELPQIDVVSLFCQTDLAPFYEQFGFKVRGKQIVLHKNKS